MTEVALTLTQFQQVLGNAIRMTRGVQNVWVQAEFSDLRLVGGHCYMELIEKNQAGSTTAKLRAMIWAGSLGVIRRKFIEATGRDISNGLKVLVRGSATHHPVYGLSFTISDIDPSYTLGDMERIRREILNRLAQEGVLNDNKSLELPVAPQRIAVISAAGAAGYGDFINQIESNPDRFKIYKMLFPAVMQGERTPNSVMSALDKVEMTIDQWDIVVIIRGGGATTDLNGFDNLELARRVATFPLPIVVGIGHERDRTVLDEIACVRCKTPTAVAAWIIDTLRGALGTVNELVTKIARYGAEAMRGELRHLDYITQSIPALARTQIMRRKMQLAGLARDLPAKVQSEVGRERLHLTRQSLRVENAAKSQIEKLNLRLENIGKLINVLSPMNTLKRGYSITRVDGKTITDPAV
ncbi:MAG: exodeoxyribonuclease VII large subunit, partial [Muribaculaceae bacterium]|nr:exodeoxyribonuclease VII large subunit [Muribaculaceae bacterium]